MPGPETFQPLGSSHIASVEYDFDAQTMTVEFTSSDRYEYRNVPQEVFRRWQTASSAGEFFQRQVKGRFATESV